MSNKQQNKPKLWVTLIMLDGSPLGVPIYDTSKMGEVQKQIFDNWYEYTKDDPKKHDHFDLMEDKCPSCGGPMRGRLTKDVKSCFVWCLNKDCGYHNIETEQDQVRIRIFEKAGIKLIYTHKTGCLVIMSNRPAPKKK